MQDSGQGISSNDLPFVFDRFRRADSPQVRKYEGTGIGLAFVKELVALMQGSVEVESEPGTRTTFKVTLPLEKSATVVGTDKSTIEEVVDDVPTANTPNISEKKAAQSSLPLLLIVEDNPDVARHIADCVKNDYCLVFAANGREGIERALALVPDLIISDVMMPEAGGIELTQSLKADERTSHVPIVLLTARVDIESRLEGLEAGADDYLPKPFNQKELRTRLHNLLTSRRRLHERYTNPFLPPPLSTDRAFQREDAFVQKVRSTIEAHLSEEGYGVEQLATNLRMSRSTLSRKWYALANQDLGKLIVSLRLRHARQLIETTDSTVAQVAFESGFSDPSYFAKLFQKEFGVKPSSLKK